MEKLKLKELPSYNKGDVVHYNRIEDGSNYYCVVTKDFLQEDNNKTFRSLETVDVTTLNKINIPTGRLKTLVTLVTNPTIIKNTKQQLLENKSELISKDISILGRARESLEFIYPGLWDIHINTENLSEIYYDVIIKFPKIEITNSKNHSHIIHDLYVKWKFGPGFKMIKTLAGIRGSLDYIENKVGYRHSHLPSTSSIDTQFSQFCLGTGDFRELHTEWTQEDHEFVQEEFELLLYQLGAYVKWESLGGGPYMRIQNIAVGNSSSYINTHDDYKIAIEKLTNFPLKYNYTTKRFTIDITALEKELSKIEEIYKVSKTSDGQYIYGDLSLNTIREWIAVANIKMSRKPLFIFQEEEVYQKVIKISSKEKDSLLEKVVHPRVCKYVSELLTSSTNNYFIKKYGK